MIETFFSGICEYAPHAHWIIFGLLMLAGLNIPISEDLLLLIGGAVAALCIPEHTLHLYAWIFFGSWISAWECYWIGRLLGPKLYEMPWLRHYVTEKRIKRLHHYYEKFGVFVFVVGRFMPGGIRNGLTLTAGMGKMPFLKFILRDGVGCLLATSTIFTIGYVFASKHDEIFQAMKRYEEIAGAIIVLILISVIIYIWYHRKSDDKA